MSEKDISEIHIRVPQLSNAAQIAGLCQQFGNEIDSQVVGETFERVSLIQNKPFLLPPTK